MKSQENLNQGLFPLGLRSDSETTQKRRDARNAVSLTLFSATYGNISVLGSRFCESNAQAPRYSRISVISVMEV